MSGWASDPWGAGPWGGAMPAAPPVRYLRAVATNVLRATLTVPAKAVHRSRWDDALNPDNWTVTRSDGAAAPRLLRVDAVAPLSNTEAPHVPTGSPHVIPVAGTEFDLVFASPLVSGLGYVVTAPGVGAA